MGTKHRLRLLARNLGLDVRSYGPFSDDYQTLAFIISKLGLKTILDIGANNGGFAGHLFEAGFAGRIISFEPLPDAHAALARRAADNPRWQVAPAVALSDRQGEAEFYVAGNSSSSSLLPMKKLHEDVAPESGKVGTIRVKTDRLDAILPEFVRADEPLFLKIDTQGSELKVLEGAADILQNVAAIRAELSFAPLYEGQVLFDELYGYLAARGFAMWEITPVLRDPHTGRMLQSDGTFVRTT